jgi:hypothetical protein
VVMMMIMVIVKGSPEIICFRQVKDLYSPSELRSSAWIYITNPPIKIRADHATRPCPKAFLGEL